MEVASQLSLFLANRPGTLGEVCEVLSKAKVNIHALTISDAIDHAVLRIVVDQSQKALDALEPYGTLTLESEVILIEGANKPGSMAKIANALALSKINIEYAYCATSPKSPRGLLVLKPNNIGKALKVLNQLHTKS